jgi:predicted 3-demethylubiquinone-9 3-methyltransferase (glyoxalase superfamily)
MNAFQGFPRITPFLWFDSNAEEAVAFYLTVFKNSRRLDEVRTTEAGPGPKGSILTIEFELDGQKFTALNGGPKFNFTEAVSFVVRCDSQKEVDYYWSQLTAAGGSESQCGWLAAGSKTSSASPGRSCRHFSPISSSIPRPSRPCCK